MGQTHISQIDLYLYVCMNSEYASWAIYNMDTLKTTVGTRQKYINIKSIYAHGLFNLYKYIIKNRLRCNIHIHISNEEAYYDTTERLATWAANSWHNGNNELVYEYEIWEKTYSIMKQVENNVTIKLHTLPGQYVNKKIYDILLSEYPTIDGIDVISNVKKQQVYDTPPKPIVDRDTGKPFTYAVSDVRPIKICQMLIESFPKGNTNPKESTDWFTLQAAYDNAKDYLHERGISYAQK